MNILPLFRSFLTLLPNFLLLLSASGDFPLLFFAGLMTSFGFCVGGMNTIGLADPFCEGTLLYGKLLTLVDFLFGVCLMTAGFCFTLWVLSPIAGPPRAEFWKLPLIAPTPFERPSRFGSLKSLFFTSSRAGFFGATFNFGRLWLTFLIFFFFFLVFNL